MPLGDELLGLLEVELVLVLLLGLVLGDDELDEELLLDELFEAELVL